MNSYNLLSPLPCRLAAVLLGGGLSRRLVFKLATRHGCLDSGVPYLQCEIYGYHPSRTLRSSSALLLQQQPATISFAARAFCAAAPTVWNSLGVHTRSADTFLTFKNRLKTELFQSCYILVTVLAPTQRSRFACEMTCKARYEFICIVLYCIVLYCVAINRMTPFMGIYSISVLACQYNLFYLYRYHVVSNFHKYTTLTHH